jgi:hypothetical protein
VAFFDTFSLEKGEFSSWLDQRPDIMGAGWRLEHCQVVIYSKLGGFDPIVLKAVALKQDVLLVYDLSEATEAMYNRVKQ